MAARQTTWIDSPGDAPAGTRADQPVFRTDCPAELTAANGESFGRQVNAALRGCHSIDMNLAGTSFMDCAGFGVLIALGKQARRRQGTLRVFNPTPPVSRLFAIVQAGDTFEIGHPALVRFPGMTTVHPLELSPPVGRGAPGLKQSPPLEGEDQSPGVTGETPEAQPDSNPCLAPFCLRAEAVKPAA